MNITDLAERLWGSDGVSDLSREQQESLYHDFIGNWVDCWDYEPLRFIVDWEICLNIPMWIVCQTFERLLFLTNRDGSILQNYASFVRMHISPHDGEETAMMLREEASKRLSGQHEEAEQIRADLPEYFWGDRVRVKASAPSKLRPGQPAMIYVAATSIDDDEEAISTGGEIGEWSYSLQLKPVDSFQRSDDWGFVAERWLDLEKTFRRPNEA